MGCAIEYGEADVKAKRKRVERAATALKRKSNREAKVRIKTRSQWLKEAQNECNTFIRFRDRGQNCISCGRVPKKSNAGHYRSVGSAPELRFHPWNINLQCEHCNSWKSGNAVDYRISLVQKIGEKAVEWLEGAHQAQKYTVEDAKEIKAYYKQQLKLLRGKS